jgi:hypothetical protein
MTRRGTSIQAVVIRGKYLDRQALQIVDGQIIRERHYRVLAAGQSAWRRSNEFYSNVSKLTRRGMAHET